MAAEPLWHSADIADRWRQGAERRARVLGPVTERMLDAAGVSSGQRVLDLAAGTGDQTLLAAKRVGPTGSVLAVDVSASMLQEAQRAARAAGLTNIQTMVADGSSMQLEPRSFDAAISRLGLMFMSDLQAALAAVRDAVKPGARFAALVWCGEDRNPWMGVPIAVVREAGRMPSPTPGVVQAVSLGEAGVLETAMKRAGFNNVHVEQVDAPREAQSLDEVAELLSPAIGTGTAELMSRLSEEDRQPLLQQMLARFKAYQRADGTLLIPGSLWLGVGECYDQGQSR